MSSTVYPSCAASGKIDQVSPPEDFSGEEYFSDFSSDEAGVV
jgi:hypothetical protein